MAHSLTYSKGINMLGTYLRRLFIGAAICAIGASVVGGVACSSAPRKVPAGTSGSAGSTGSTAGSAGSTGTAGSTTSGSAGTTTGTAGDSGGGTAGTSGAAGATTGSAGATGTAGAAGAGTAGASGTTGTAGGGTAGDGTAGTAVQPVDMSITTAALPVAVTEYWFPSGWGGDAATVAQFQATVKPIKIEDQSVAPVATTGPCSKRIAGALGHCFKVTYNPVMSDAGATNAFVALIPATPNVGTPNFDPALAPHVPAGATKITAEVAGDVGGEAVTFNLWTTDSGNLFSPTLATGQAWQKISLPLVGVTYDKEESPFGWSSASTKPIVFYYDDVRIDNAP
jgi:hypothetical protein